MKTSRTYFVALLALVAADGWAASLHSEMEAANSRWLTAYNTMAGPAKFAALYTKDAMVLPPGAQPIVGAEAIGEFWADRVKNGTRKNHTFEIITTQRDGNFAYQVARWTVDVLNDKGESTRNAGYTVRVFERQPTGAWLVKIHVWTVTT